MSKGKVWLIGAGPGDPGLFTLKGKEILEQAQVVVYDRLIGTGILTMMPADAEKIDAGKQAGNHKIRQERINTILLEKALEGKRVVRLKGGDPFVFGRGGEELELLAENNIDFEIVPGITSAVAVPAYAGIPVTHRDFTSSLHIITAHRRADGQASVDYQKLANLGDVTLVFLMGIGSLNEITEGLIAAGKSPQTPAAILENGTTCKQRRVIGTLQSLPALAEREQIGTPGIILVGNVCTLSERFAWAEKRVLAGLRAVVTRPQEKASSLAKRLRQLGADVFLLPSIQTQEIKENEPFRQMMPKMGQAQWAVFTSSAGVKAFFSQLLACKKDLRSFPQLKFAAVGPATAQALREHGVLADLLPEQYYGKELGKCLLQEVQPGDHIVLFKPKDVQSDCTDVLRQAQVSVTEIPLYETVLVRQDILHFTWEPNDLAVFTSASSVRGFAANLPDLDYTQVLAVCIGEKTAAQARSYGMKTVLSDQASIDSLVKKVTELYNERMLS